MALTLLASACSSGKGSAKGKAGDGTGGDSSVSGSGSSGPSVGAGGSDLFGALSSSSTPPGLTTTANASSTTLATRAVIVVEPEPRGAFLATGGGQLQPQDRKAVTDAVGALGVRPEDLSFEGQGVYGTPRVQVTLSAASAPTTGQQVIDAVEKVLGRAASKGAVFFASDCAATTSALQKQAFQGAEAKARQLADNSGLRLGAVVSVSQAQVQSEGPLPSRSAVDPCDPTTLAGRETVALKAVDDPATVDINVGLAVTWAIAGAPAAGTGPRTELVAVGRGSSTSVADEAYVAVIFSSEDQNAKPLSRKDRDDLEQAITGLGIAKKDVQIVTANQYGPVTIVQVETKVNEVAQRGDQVQRAAEKVLGRSYAAGVRFGLSTCDQALAKARKAAVADARARAATLAEAASVRAGDVQTVSESASSLGADPCDDSAAALLRLGEYGEYADLVQPFDAKPEFRVESTVRLGFAVAG